MPLSLTATGHLAEDTIHHEMRDIRNSHNKLKLEYFVKRRRKLAMRSLKGLYNVCFSVFSWPAHQWAPLAETRLHQIITGFCFVMGQFKKTSTEEKYTLT